MSPEPPARGATAPSGPPAFAVYFEPYTFRGASAPHGFQYCIRQHMDHPHYAETIRRGFCVCVSHGIVFGPLENIAVELEGVWKEWAEAGDLPYLPTPKPIRELGRCHLEPRVVYIRPTRTRRLPKHASAADQRIYAARLAAENRRELMRGCHV